jgi:hypothetical protein
VDGALWQELLAVLDGALHDGRRRALVRLAEREQISAEEAGLELAAFPARSCAALERGVGLTPARCVADQGCPVREECPFVQGQGPAAIGRSALAHLVGALAHRWRKPLPAAPFATLAELPALVRQLLERSGRIRTDSPPRARTALAVADLALRRGGPVGASGAFLTAAELEQVAAFLPPGSGRGDPRLAPVESWIRRAVSAEVALVDPASGRSR